MNQNKSYLVNIDRLFHNNSKVTQKTISQSAYYLEISKTRFKSKHLKE